MLKAFICENCGNIFERQRYPSSTKNGKTFQFCSVNCAHAAHRRYPDAICPVCSKLFPKSRDGAMKYCSQDCAHLASQDRVVVTCACCKERFQVKKSRLKRGRSRYCSRRCADTAKEEPETHITKKCLNCKKEFVVLKSQVRLRGGGKYCSNACRFQYCQGVNSPVWKGGYAKYYGPNWARQSRKTRRRDSYTCQFCGLKQKFPRLHVHHIVPLKQFNSDWEAANNLDNLITLCGPCHSRVENGKSACPIAKAG